MICPNCGAANTRTATFCAICRTPLEGVQSSPDVGLYREPVYAAPSDYVASLGLVQPKRRRRRMRASSAKALTTTVWLLILAGLVVLGYLSYTWFFNTETYSSTKSSLSFRYPKSWQEVDTKDALILERLGVAMEDLSDVNEVLLSDSISEDAEWVLGAGTISGLVYTNWKEIKPIMVDELSKEFSTDWAGTPLQFKDVTADGEPALEVSTTEVDMGITYRYKALLFNRGRLVYLLFMVGVRDQGDVDAQWNRVIGSIHMNE